VKALLASLPVRLALMLGALVLGISGYGFHPGHPQGMRTVSMPGTRASALVIITNPASPTAMRATGALVIASARPREQVIIFPAPPMRRPPGRPACCRRIQAGALPQLRRLLHLLTVAYPHSAVSVDGYAAPSTAPASASWKTMLGLLPPSSSVTFFKFPAAARRRFGLLPVDEQLPRSSRELFDAGPRAFGLAGMAKVSADAARLPRAAAACRARRADAPLPLWCGTAA